MAPIMNPSRFSGSSANMNDTGLLGYWTMDEACGAVVNVSQSADTVGTCLGNGSVTNATQSCACGLIGGHILFDACGEKVQFGCTLSTFNETLSSTAKFTINLWVKPTTTSHQDIILDQTDAKSTLYGFVLDFRGTCGALRAVTYCPSACPTTLYDSGVTTATVGTGAWHMITVRYDYSLCSNNLTVTVDDGTDEYSCSRAGTPGDNNPSGNLTLGEAYLGNDNPYDGLVDELSFWNRALSDAEVTTLYNSGAGFSIY
jgi:hypothetical protein